MNNNQRIHLTDEEFVAFILEDLPEDREREIDQHLETCMHCTTMLESFYESQQSFPTEEWSLRRRSFVTELRQQVILPKQSVLMTRLMEQLRELVLPQGDWSLSLATAQAATSEHLEDGQTDDGILRWRVVEDEERNLVIRLGSHEVALAGMKFLLRAGSWQQSIILQKVAPNQIGAEAIIDRVQRTQLETTARLQIESADKPSAMH